MEWRNNSQTVSYKYFSWTCLLTFYCPFFPTGNRQEIWRTSLVGLCDCVSKPDTTIEGLLHKNSGNVFSALKPSGDSCLNVLLQRRLHHLSVGKRSNINSQSDNQQEESIETQWNKGTLSHQSVSWRQSGTWMLSVKDKKLDALYDNALLYTQHFSTSYNYCYYLTLAVCTCQGERFLMQMFSMLVTQTHPMSLSLVVGLQTIWSLIFLQIALGIPFPLQFHIY